ncbi:phytochelatin synthase family protein [Yoonia vestfoldensis]|uniref:glutathione gamma-glutamylcysteinyltransferase n=1 Tax=Yoonia vestfoldensis TaxID=245188 RepID=A0A1Y0EAL0_9RHOB|nr:phytochelatin synthase family protein [Yoonia vestfoldensis]ARU00667.1 phytochelatin synthase [Yoonia vestfoldensis]
MSRFAFGLAVSVVAALPAMAQDPDDYAKLGADAQIFTADTAYLRAAPAPDYWAFSAFVKPQFTTSACSIGTVTAAINGIMGQPAWASQTIMTQEELLDLTGNATWAALSAEGGDGVTFQQLVDFTGAALAAVGLDRIVTPFHPKAATDDARAQLVAMLVQNETSADDAVMVYFNQGVVTGDWDGPHIALIGAYDAAKDRVLILEVDQHWYVPYWTSVDVLLAAMVKPTSAEHGVLEGETGGLVMIRAAS